MEEKLEPGFMNALHKLEVRAGSACGKSGEGSASDGWLRTEFAVLSAALSAALASGGCGAEPVQPP